jgi:hypothetical protein
MTHPRFDRHPGRRLRALDPGRRLQRHLLWGGALIAVGLAALLRNQGLFSARELWLAVPALLVWSGAVRLVHAHSLGAVARAAGRFAVAAYLVVVIEHVGGLTFAATWPVLLIALGAASVGRALFGPARPDRGACEGRTW